MLTFGPVSKRTILSEPRHPPRPDDDDTIGFIKLEDSTKLPILVYLLNDYQFHGKYLKAEMCFFSFNYLEEYAPILQKCTECSDYGHMLRVRERRLKEQAIMDETERINNNNAEKRRLMVVRKNAVPEVDCASVLVSHRPRTHNIGVQVESPAFCVMKSNDVELESVTVKETLNDSFVKLEFDFYN